MGVQFFGECVFLHRASRSLIVTDSVQNHTGPTHRGFGAILNKLMLQPLGFKNICVAPPLRLKMVVKNPDAMRAFVKRVQSWDFDRVIVTHGDVIDVDAKAVLERICQKIAI